MTTLQERAAALLYPEGGRRAVDVKFFIQPGATADNLAQQVISCFAAMEDPTSVITDVDAGITATA